MGQCIRCGKNKAVRNNICFRCFRKENKGKYPYESMKQHKRKSSLSLIVGKKGKKIDPELKDFIEDITKRKHNKHIISILCLCSRELNRIIEKYINEKEMEVQDIRLVKETLRKLEVICK